MKGLLLTFLNRELAELDRRKAMGYCPTKVTGSNPVLSTNKHTQIMATEYWTQKDGTKISVDDMSVKHLRNTLKLLIKRNRIKEQKFENPDCDATEMDIY